MLEEDSSETQLGRILYGHAALVSERSTCLRRKVGAILVKRGGF